MRNGGAAARVAEFLVEERRRALSAGRRILEVPPGWAGGALTPAGERYDGAWVELREVDGLDLRALGRELGAALPSGAPLVCVVPGARPLARTLRRALRAEDATGGPGREGQARPVALPSLREWREALGGAFAWTRARGLGILVPPRGEEDWVEDSPGAFALLAALEHVVGTWPVLRGLGERTLLEGVRR